MSAPPEWSDASEATYTAEMVMIGGHKIIVCLDDEGVTGPAYYWDIDDRQIDGWAKSVAMARRSAVAIARKLHRIEVIDAARLERAGVSRNGNPHFWVYTRDGYRYRTSADSSVGYGIENFWSTSTPARYRQEMTIALSGRAANGRGRIVDAYHVENGKKIRP